MSTTMIVAVGISVMIGAAIVIFATVYLGKERKDRNGK